MTISTATPAVRLDSLFNDPVILPKPSPKPGDRFYGTPSGLRLPSVTTVLSVIAKDLEGWTAKVEREAAYRRAGEVLAAMAKGDAPRVVLRPRPAAEEIRTDAARFGTQVHALIEHHVKRQLGQPCQPPSQVPPAVETAFTQWLRWWEQAGLVPIAAERVLSCSVCGFAGTADLIADDAGSPRLIDWKTSSRIGPEHFLQTKAYSHALTIEATPLIVRIPRDGSEVEEHPVPESVTLEPFLRALGLWRWLREIEGYDVGDAPSGTHAGGTV